MQAINLQTQCQHRVHQRHEWSRAALYVVNAGCPSTVFWSPKTKTAEPGSTLMRSCASLLLSVTRSTRRLSSSQSSVAASAAAMGGVAGAGVLPCPTPEETVEAKPPCIPGAGATPHPACLNSGIGEIPRFLTSGNWFRTTEVAIANW